MDLDLPPTTEGQLRHAMLSATNGADWPIPAVVRQRSKGIIEPVGPGPNVDDQIPRRPPGAGLDLRRPAGNSTGILVDELAAGSSLDPADHRFGIACEVRQHVPDRPPWQERGTTSDGVGDLADRSTQSLMCVTASLDLGGWPLHDSQS